MNRHLLAESLLTQTNLQGGERMESIEGTRSYGGYLVIVQGEQPDRTQSREAVIAHTADTVAP